VDDGPEFYFPETWRGRPVDKKQGSSGSVDKSVGEWALMATATASHNYSKLIEEGVAPEQARMILPLNTYSEWYWSGSLDAFANMAKLRLGKDSQEETREIAKQISNIMEDKFPISWSSLVNESL
jgi:thymidylate synthase (FAD)